MHGFASLLARASASRWPMAAAVLSFLLLLTIALWMWRGAALATTRTAGERFEFKVAEGQFAIEQRLLAYTQILRGGVGLFAARRDVSRAEWRDYVRTLAIEQRFPGIQGLGYVVALAPGGVAAHLEKVRGEGFPDYDIRPAGQRPDYSSIAYIEPFDWRNLRSFGYDMLTEPVLQKAMLRARDEDLPAASGKVTLVQETADGVQSGFVMCMPVYRDGATKTSIEQRRAALAGYVCSLFRMGDLMQGILGPDTLPDIRLQVFDGAPSSDSLMYDSLEGADGPQQAAFSRDREFEFDGHRWTLRFASLPDFEASIDMQRPRLVLVSGLLVSVLLSAVIWSLLLNWRRARALAAGNVELTAEIAERTKLETELKRARNAAEAANQAKSDFLANVSHELRTPLTLILAPLEQLLAEPAPLPNWRTHLDRVQRNARLLMARVNDILDFSKAEAGKFELHLQAIDLVQTLGQLAGDAAVAAEGKGCVMTWEVDPALDRVCLDLHHLEKIALNLMSNAIKFTPAQGTIRVTAIALDETRFELAVEDSGVGIAPDKLSLLFERFSQVDSSSTRHYGGTGIGLALVRELATQMGGTVGVESEPGRGSRFFVQLPRNTDLLLQLAPHRPENNLPRHAWQPVAATTPAGSTPPRPHDHALPKILVVDDSPEMRAYIEELLGVDCTVMTAEDGEAAWAMLQRKSPDVIVSDVMMPRLDGFGLTARIKACPSLSHIPVILLTARGGADASVAGLDTGAHDYVAKPFSPLELKARVGAALRMTRMQAELRDKSRQAGMAQIATNVLHNVGNVLNSVNISASLVSNKLRGSKLPGLARAVRLMDEHAGDLGHFISVDDKGRLLPDYLKKLSDTLATEQHALIDEMGQLAKSIDHIKEVVATQQSYAGTGRMTETVDLGELVDDALRMNAGALTRHQVNVAKEVADLPLLSLDRHRVLLILINLISNAKYAMAGVPDQDHLITLQVDMGAQHTLRIRVADNGEGIEEENMTRIFAHGFTTRKEGHGFGLHSCALAAKEMNGTLSAHSDGPGRGAVFVLELPFQPVAVAA